MRRYHSLIAAWTAAAAVALGMAADRWTKLPPPRPLVQTWGKRRADAGLRGPAAGATLGKAASGPNRT